VGHYSSQITAKISALVYVLLDALILFLASSHASCPEQILGMNLLLHIWFPLISILCTYLIVFVCVLVCLFVGLSPFQLIEFLCLICRFSVQDYCEWHAPIAGLLSHDFLWREYYVRQGRKSFCADKIGNEIRYSIQFLLFLFFVFFYFFLFFYLCLFCR
jgi:hypothetical protein